MQKRGISPIISTILIISLTIIIAVIVMTWGFSTYNKYKDKTQEESEVALMCSKTGFGIKEACVLADNVHVVLENTGSQAITGFLYRVGNQEGERSISETINGLDVYSRKQLVDSEFNVVSFGSPKDVEIFPKINFNGKDYICSYSQKHDIGPCFNILNLGESAIGYETQTGKSWVNIVKGSELSTLIEDMNDAFPTLDFELQNQLAVPEKVLGSAGISDGYVLSPDAGFKIPEDSQVTHLAIYGETNELVKVSLVGDNELILYPLGKNADGTLNYLGEQGEKLNFEYRLNIENLREKNVRLKIDYAGVGNNPTYFMLYRFCYTDYNSGCIE